MSGVGRHTTVRELQDLALGPGALLVAGERGLERAVTWVTSLHAAYPLFAELEQGYLALASPEVARRIDSQLTLAYLVRELHRAQAAGLVVDEEPDEEACSLAGELSLPLFVVPHGTDMPVLERRALRVLLDREGYLARRAQEWRESYQELLAHAGVQAVLARLAEEFHIGASLCDNHSNVLAEAHVETPLAEYGEQREFPVAVAGRALGVLSVAAHGRVSLLLAIAAQQCADVCALEMIQTCVREETQDRLGTDLVNELLSGTTDWESVRSRLVRQGYDATQGRQHAVVATSAEPEAAAGAAVSAMVNLESDLHAIAAREGISTLRLTYLDTQLCLLSVPSTANDQRLRNWLGKLSGRHLGHGCRYAVSRLASDVSGLAAAVQQALAADAMGRRLHDSTSPLFYADLGLYRLILGLRDQAEVKQFYGEMLGRLLAYDRQHNTDLVATLRAYFEQNANASETARKLYVHRNTLNYRLQRISEISGLDLGSPDTRLALQVALRIHSLET